MVFLKNIFKIFIVTIPILCFVNKVYSEVSYGWRYNPYTGRPDNVVVIGTSTIPAVGNDTEIQYNNSGYLGGDSDFTWEDSTNIFYLNGNIGIGTTNPLTSLDIVKSQYGIFQRIINTDVSGASGSQIILQSLAYGAEANIHFINGSVTTPEGWKVGLDNQPPGAISYFTIRQGNNTNPIFTITNSSDVGIGTYIPTEKLEVIGNIKSQYGIIASTGEFSNEINVSSINANDSNGLYLLDDGDNGIFIKDGGNVGIDTTAPSEKLEVVGNSNIIGDLTSKNLIQKSTFNPSFVGEVTDATKMDKATALAMRGNIVFVGAENSSYLNAINVKISTNPTIISSLDLSSYLSVAHDILDDGKYTYIFNDTASGGIIKVNSLDPSNMIFVSSQTYGTDRPYKGKINGQYIYYVSYAAQKFAIVNKDNLQLISSSASITMNGAIGIDVQGNIAAIAGFIADSVTFYNVEDKSNPTFISSISDATLLNGCENVAIEYPYCYALSYNNNTFTIIDISNITAPSIIGSVRDDVGFVEPESIFLSGDYAYVVGLGGIISRVNKSNPYSPIIEGYTDINDNNWEIIVKNGLAYFTNATDDALKIYDINLTNIDNLKAGSVNATTLNVSKKASFESEITAKNSIASNELVYAPIGNFDEVYTSTVVAKSPLYISSDDVVLVSSNSAIEFGQNSNSKIKFINQDEIRYTTDGINYKMLSPTNEVYINTMDDFPDSDPLDNYYIPLEANTKYVMNSSISSTSTFRLPPDSNIWFTTGIHPFIYSGGGTLFISTTTSICLIDYSTFVGYDIGSGSGTFCNVASPTQDSNEVFFMKNVVLSNFESLGTITNMPSSFHYFNIIGVNDGFDFIDTLTVEMTHISDFDLIDSGNILFDIQDSQTEKIIFSNCTSEIQSTNYQIKISTNLTSADITIVGNSFGGNIDNIFASNSLTQKTPNVVASGNNGLPDSTVSGQIFFEPDSAFTLNIPAIDAIVLLSTTTLTYESDDIERVEITSGKFISYIGLETTILKLSGSMNIDPANATKNLRSQFINIHAHEVAISTFTNATNTVNSYQHGLSNGDNISWFNNDGTLPAELREDILYYIVNATADTFQVSYTLGGAAVAFTDDGSGTNEYSEACLVGTAGKVNVSAANPVDCKPEGLATLETDDQITMGFFNSTDNVDIRIYSAYFNIKK